MGSVSLCYRPVPDAEFAVYLLASLSRNPVTEKYAAPAELPLREGRDGRESGYVRRGPSMDTMDAKADMFAEVCLDAVLEEAQEQEDGRMLCWRRRRSKRTVGLYNAISRGVQQDHSRPLDHCRPGREFSKRRTV